MTEITQADRDAAEEHFDLWYPNTAWGYEPLVEAFARHRQQAIEALQADNAKMREAIVVLRLGLLGVIDSDDAGAIAWAKHHGEAIDWDQYPEATRAALQEAGQ